MEDIEFIIINKLKELDIEYNTLKPFLKEYLFKVEEIILEKTNNQNLALNILKTDKFSISSIADTLGCSRTTFYNHGSILKNYI